MEKMMMDKIMNVYKKIVNGLCKTLEIIAAVSLAAMFFIVLYNIIMRYFFRASPGWAEEIARQCVVLFCFIAIALGVRDKVHISLSIFVDRVLKRITLPIEIINKVIILIFGIMMSAFMTQSFDILRYNRLPGSGLRVIYVYTIPIVVGIMISLLCVYQIYDHFKYGTDEQQKILTNTESEEEKALREGHNKNEDQKGASA
jgi:TRAP-type C4-dicarboxylate transport system permease small subunit